MVGPELKMRLCFPILAVANKSDINKETDWYVKNYIKFDLNIEQIMYIHWEAIIQKIIVNQGNICIGQIMIKVNNHRWEFESKTEVIGRGNMQTPVTKSRYIYGFCIWR